MKNFIEVDQNLGKICLRFDSDFNYLIKKFRVTISVNNTIIHSFSFDSTLYKSNFKFQKARIRIVRLANAVNWMRESNYYGYFFVWFCLVLFACI